MHVLIADDDAVSRRLLESYLKKWGYQVGVAASGEEAWRLFEADDYHLVITDWMMPELDGVGLIRRIRAAQRPGYVYTILLTARSQKEDLVEGMEAGADDFLTKPFDRDELRVRLRAGQRIIELEHNLERTRLALVQNEKLASLGRLAAGMAHEINNPVTFVINNLTGLRQDVLEMLTALEQTSPQPEHNHLDLAYLRRSLPRLFDRSLEGLQRVCAIVRNLRDFARVDEADFKAVDLNAALLSTVETLRYEINQKSLRVATAFGELPPVPCHPGKLNQVFLNLLLNAIQASERTGVIELRTRTEENGVAVEIVDRGSGINPAHLPRIFDPFFTTKPVGQGMGLGLSASYGIVRDHGGTIEAESELGHGSLFRVRLPFGIQD